MWTPTEPFSYLMIQSDNWQETVQKCINKFLFPYYSETEALNIYCMRTLIKKECCFNFGQEKFRATLRRHRVTSHANKIPVHFMLISKYVYFSIERRRRVQQVQTGCFHKSKTERRISCVSRRHAQSQV